MIVIPAVVAPESRASAATHSVRRRLRRVGAALAALTLAWTGPAVAQPNGPGAVAGANPPAPLVIHSADGRLQVTAAPATTPVRLDGVLDDEAWTRAVPVADFVQGEPNEGKPATERTEVRVAFDAGTLYVAATCYDSDPGQLVVNDIRKDFRNVDQDTFEIIIDTFTDRRNGYLFATNPEGAKSDQQVANEGRETNASWDAVWSVRTRRTAEGWTAEIAIPFKSLRFVPGQLAWGINFSRRVRRRNEVDYWSPVPRAYALSRVSLAGNLAGLENLSGGRNLRLKPYALTSSVRPSGGTSFDTDPEFGLDLKYGLTSALTLDATVNPDFAQAEADEQQVNLTQFSQFFPEKRDFFLENSGIFYVGDTARNNRVNPTPTPDEDLLLFFSRRIGLTAGGQPIPIAAGGRVTGRALGLSLGLLNVQTNQTSTTDANNYTVARVRRNIGRANDIGAVFMQRQSTESGADANRVFGLDWNMRLFGNLDWSSYVVGTRAPGKDDGQYAWRTSVNWEGNFLHYKSGVMAIGQGFQSDLSFLRRTGVRKWFVDTGIRPRPRSLQARGVREMHPHIVWSYYTDLDNRMIGKTLHTGYTFFFNNGGYLELVANPRFEHLARPLSLARKAPALPAGDYGWFEKQLRFQTDQSRLFSGGLVFTTGGLWNGTQTTLNPTLSIQPSYRVRFSLGLQRTDASLDAPVGDFVTSVWTFRTNYSFSTNMFVDSLIQYLSDRDLFNANVRFNLIHRPLSDIYVVWNEERFTTHDAPGAGRGFILKYTHMFAF